MKPHLSPTLCLALLLAAAPAAAGQPRGSFSFGLGVERLHDDNVLRLTPHDLDRLAADPTAPRFLIPAPDDDVNALAADARWRGRLVRRRETRLGASFGLDDYQKSDALDWREYGASLSQELTASQHHLARLVAWWGYIPNYYLGQVTDADDSFAAGRRIRRSLTYAQRELGIRLEQSLLRNRVQLAVAREQLKRDYDAHFDERDGENDQWRASAEFRPIRRYGATARVTWLVGRYDARGDLASSPITDTDISFDHSGVGGTLALPWGHGPSRGRAELSLMPERRRYTTADRFDVTRYGRVNHRLDTDVRVTQHVWGPLEAVAHWERLTSDATFDSGIDLPSDETNFDQTRFGVQLRARWDLATP